MFFVLLELSILFLTSRLVSQSLFSLFYGIAKREKVASQLLALVFFPGTLIHELAHFLMAKILFVRTGKISLTPQLQESGIRLGSVEVAKTDMIRRFLIGVAPLLVGGGVISVVTYYTLPHLYPFSLTLQYAAIAFFYLYGIFVIANTMFSSKKDMEGALGLLIFLAFIIVVLFVAGKGNFLIWVVQSFLSQELVQQYMQKLSILFLFPIGLNLVILVLFKFLRR